MPTQLKQEKVLGQQARNHRGVVDRYSRCRKAAPGPSLAAHAPAAEYENETRHNAFDLFGNRLTYANTSRQTYIVTELTD